MKTVSVWLTRHNELAMAVVPERPTANDGHGEFVANREVLKRRLREEQPTTVFLLGATMTKWGRDILRAELIAAGWTVEVTA